MKLKFWEKEAKERDVIKDDKLGNIGAPPEPVSKEKKHQALTNKFYLLVALFLVLIIAVIAIKIVSYVGGITRVRLTDEGFTHDKRFEDCIVVQGIDVSEYQNKIHWKKVKSSGADFVFVRAAYRKGESGELMEDETFRKNIKAANKAGLMVGAYIYSQAVNTKEAEEEAEFLIKLVKRYDIDMPLVIDYEILKGGRLEQAIKNEELYAASQFNDIVEAFCRKVEKEGYESAVYGNYDMFKNYMDATLIDEGNTLWAAQYGGSCEVKADYMFWQTTDSAMVGGINGNVDQDFWYIKPGEVYKTRAKGKKKQVSIAECTVKFDGDSVKLKNRKAEPEFKITLDDKELKEGRDFECGYLNNTQSGTGYLYVRGIRKYKDWRIVSFTIE